MINGLTQSKALSIAIGRLKTKLLALDRIGGVHDHKRIEYYEEFTKIVELLVGCNQPNP